MKKYNNKFIIGLFILFICLLSLTIYTGFNSNLGEQKLPFYTSFSGNDGTEEIVIKSMTPVYDVTSSIVVDQTNVIFNDKNQVVKYNVVIENTQNYDVKISDIKLSTPTEEFLSYRVDGIEKDEVLCANSTKDLIVSFEIMGIDGWGRNFADELTANITFEKVVEEVIPPVEDGKVQEEQPEAPVINTEELMANSEEIDVNSIVNGTIEFKQDIKLEVGQKVGVWIYSKPIFLGYFDVIETNGVKQLVGIEEAIKKVEIVVGEHNIVLVSKEKETIGYISVYVNEKKELLNDKSQDTTDKEDLPTTNPSTDSKDELPKNEEEKVENPYTSDNGLVMVFGIATFITGIVIVVLCNKKVAKYTVFILLLTPMLMIVDAEEIIELSIKNNVSFESQNVMKKAYSLNSDHEPVFRSYWGYSKKIKNFYIKNEIIEIKEYDYKFDVSASKNGRVVAYLVKNKDDSTYYDAYLIADGIIYPNTNASGYFYQMINLDKIDNLAGIDTSNVTNMYRIFAETGRNSKTFTLDVSSLDTSNVTNMLGMFEQTGFTSSSFTLDVSNFNTSKVTDMSRMFNQTGYNSTEFVLDLSGFDTSNVTDMKAMFEGAGYSNPGFILDVSSFDTSNVKDMSYMFSNAGYNSTKFVLDVSGFDTSNVTDMRTMFKNTGYSNPGFTLDVSNFNTSKVTSMKNMFFCTGYSSTKLNTSFTISNPNSNLYEEMFNGVALKKGAQIIVNYTSKTDLVASSMITTKSSDSNVVKGTCIDCGEDYVPMGTEIDINGEKFNVISQTDDTVTMLAQYNLGTDYKQSTTTNDVTFSNTGGWEYTSGPKEIDIQTWSTNPKTYVNAYVEYLKEELGDDIVTGDLITLTELSKLGCTVPSNYSGGYYSTNATCVNSPYDSWLVNGQDWWTRSASSEVSDYVWFVKADGTSRNHFRSTINGVRPVITISKDTLKGL